MVHRLVLFTLLIVPLIGSETKNFGKVNEDPLSNEKKLVYVSYLIIRNTLGVSDVKIVGLSSFIFQLLTIFHESCVSFTK